MPRQHVTVTVEAINTDYGYTIIEIAASNAQPASFAVHYEGGKYHLSQTGENNYWTMYPDERK